MSTSRALTVREPDQHLSPRRQSLPFAELAWDDPRRLSTSVSRPVIYGYAIILLFVAALFGWGSWAPIAGGAHAPGIISPEGSRKSVQHLEGGIVENIRIADGDVVEAGQPLVVLSNIQSKATFDMLSDERRTLLAKLARLEAEKDDRAKLILPAELQLSSGGLRDVISSQAELLETRRARYLSRYRLLRQKIDQLNEQISGFKAQVVSTTRQLALIREEAHGKEKLLRKGYIPKPELLRMQRMEAEIQGRQGEYLAAIARARQQIGEAEIEQIALAAERADQIASESDKYRNELAQVEEKLRASQDILQRTVVRAPVSGTIVNLKFKNSGAVVQRGETILEIVPSVDKLMIEARISPLDIDIVRGGLHAKVNFVAYSTRSAPQITATVKSISADRLVEKDNQRPYYLAKVEVDRAELADRAPNVQLIPGMPVDVLIVTEERTMLEYLLQPFRDALRRSFREA